MKYLALGLLLYRCIRSKRYPNAFCAIRAMRIAAMYGHHGRVENCNFCDQWHYFGSSR